MSIYITKYFGKIDFGEFGVDDVLDYTMNIDGLDKDMLRLSKK